ncbi:hypothetical protein M885DRAFT_601708 [Pelagophyceae sp. CCMP2097]|nr:hypothetical protein M885DRAFT_601708 [Pelagophyceae sp. CCMP2097]
MATLARGLRMRSVTMTSPREPDRSRRGMPAPALRRARQEGRGRGAAATPLSITFADAGLGVTRGGRGHFAAWRGLGVRRPSRGRGRRWRACRTSSAAKSPSGATNKAVYGRAAQRGRRQTRVVAPPREAAVPLLDEDVLERERHRSILLAAHRDDVAAARPRRDDHLRDVEAQAHAGHDDDGACRFGVSRDARGPAGRTPATARRVPARSSSSDTASATWKTRSSRRGRGAPARLPAGGGGGGAAS